MKKYLPLSAVLLLPALSFAATRGAQKDVRVEVRIEKSDDSSTGGIVRFGQDIIVGENETISGPAVAFGGHIKSAGRIDGPAVSFGGSVNLRPTARVNGPVVSFGGRTLLAQGSQVNGPVVETPGAELFKRLATAVASLAAGIGGIYLILKTSASAGWVVLGVVLIAVFPKALARTKDRLERSPVESGLIGLIAWPALGVISATLFLSLIGWPLLPLLAALAAAAYVWGFAALGYLVGTKLAMGRWKNQLLGMAVGMLALKLLQWVPVVQWLVCAAVALFGVGATILSGFGVKRS